MTQPISIYEAKHKNNIFVALKKLSFYAPYFENVRSILGLYLSMGPCVIPSFKKIKAGVLNVQRSLKLSQLIEDEKCIKW